MTAPDDTKQLHYVDVCMKSSAKQRQPANPQPFQAFWFLYLNNEPDFKTSLQFVNPKVSLKSSQ